MKSAITINVLFSFALAFSLVACKEKEEIEISECSGITPSYNLNIKSILDSNCVSCHNASSKQAGYDFSTYSSTKTGAAKKNFLGAIQHKDGYSAMPKNSAKLSNESIQIISCWVQNGMPE